MTTAAELVCPISCPAQDLPKIQPVKPAAWAGEGASEAPLVAEEPCAVDGCQRRMGHRKVVYTPRDGPTSV